MTIAENKALVRRYFSDMDRGNLDYLDEVLATGYQKHVTDQPTSLDLARAKSFAADFYRAFPDLKHRIDDQIGEDDRVATRITIAGTQQAEFQGFPASGRRIEFAVQNVSRLTDNQIVEQWFVIDVLAIREQLS